MSLFSSLVSLLVKIKKSENKTRFVRLCKLSAKRNRAPQKATAPTVSVRQMPGAGSTITVGETRALGRQTVKSVANGNTRLTPNQTGHLVHITQHLQACFFYVSGGNNNSCPFHPAVSIQWNTASDSTLEMTKEPKKQ